jgi:hypothetical protein
MYIIGSRLDPGGSLHVLPFGTMGSFEGLLLGIL